MGGSDRVGAQVNAFRRAVSNCGLGDIPFSGNKFTWSNRRVGGDFIQARLDRAMADKGWASLFNRAEVLHLSEFSSDHLPLIIHTTGLIRGRRSGGFRFDNGWNKLDGCISLVRDVWQRGARASSLWDCWEKLSGCRRSLSGWRKRHPSNFESQIKEKLNQLEEIQPNLPRFEATYKIREIHKEITGIQRHEEAYWKQRAKCHWLRDEDRNTKFFHAFASRRQRRNIIEGLFDDCNRWSASESTMEDIALRYFLNIFHSNGQLDLSKFLDHVDKKLSFDDNVQLTQIVSEEKVTFALNQMDSDKAPGPDGLTAGFFKEHWNMLKGEILISIRDFLNGGIVPENFNLSHIVLIPKKQCSKAMADFRPISLCNTLYKLVSKVLANRLKPILAKVISNNQSAFLPGRLISDNIVLAYELTHKIKKCTKGREGYCVIKTDMSKAFDRVEWPYLRAIMIRLGFNVTWVNWVMRCIESISFSVIINEKAGPIFSPERGLRQGDPLSPFLFLLCLEGLSSSLLKAQENNLISGCKVASRGPAISHLFFADDSVFFVKANRQEAGALEQIFVEYGAASGQEINYDKSDIFFSPNSSSHSKEQVMSILKIREVISHDKYLGMPLVVGKSKINTFRDISDKIWGKLSSWSAKFLSRAGKEILIKAVIQAIPSFIITCFRLPKKIIAEIELAIRSFWWGGARKTRWVGWKMMSTAKGNGGMGFRDLNAFNLALLSKQGWRLIQEPNSLVARSLKARYFPHNNFFEAKLGSNPSFTWRSILAGRDILIKGGIWRVGNGNDIRILEDPWMPPDFSFPSGAAQSLRASRLVWVSQLLDYRSGEWNVRLVRNSFDNASAESILQVPILKKEADRFAWKVTKDSVFSVRSAYFFALKVLGRSCSSPVVPEFWSSIWKLNVQPKVKSFLWRLGHQSIPTLDSLFKRGMVLNVLCPVCGEAPENIAHLFMSCRWALFVWQLAFPGLNSLAFVNENFFDWYGRLHSVLLPSDWIRFNMLLWFVSKNRNSAVFNAACFPPLFAIELARQAISDFSFAAAFAININPVICWKKPPRSFVKINFDAAVFSSSLSIGLGIVFRDCDGRVTFCKWLLQKGSSDIVQAEALALLIGVKLAKEAGLRKICFESDALFLIQAINSGRPSFLSCRNTIRDIKGLAQCFDSCFFAYSPRESNRLAHKLANLKENDQGRLPESLNHVALLDLQ